MLIAYAALVFASVSHANAHWEAWLGLFAYLSFFVCALLAFHRRSTLFAAYCVFYLFGHALCDTYGFYMFNDAIMALRAEEDYYTKDIVYTHVYVACGIVGTLTAHIAIARSVESAERCG